MILDGYWKKEIQKQIELLKIHSTITVVPDYQKHVINKALLLTAIAARKVWEDEEWAEREAKLFKSQLLDTKIPVTIFLYEGDPLPPGEVCPDHYIQKEAKTINAKYVINSIIHSYYWSLIYGKDGSKVEGFGVSSEKYKNELYYVKMHDWIMFLEIVLDTCHIY